MSKIDFLFLKTLFLKNAVESPILLKVAQHFLNEMNIVIKFQVRIPLTNISFDFNEKTQKAKNIPGPSIRQSDPIGSLRILIGSHRKFVRSHGILPDYIGIRVAEIHRVP